MTTQVTAYSATAMFSWQRQFAMPAGGFTS